MKEVQFDSTNKVINSGTKMLIFFFRLWTDGFPSTIFFSLEEEEELEGGGPAEFTCFPEDLVAEQLTYMDAVGLLTVPQMGFHLNVGTDSTGGLGRPVGECDLSLLWSLREAVPINAEWRCDLNQSSE